MLYLCIICKRVSTSITDLHNHHVQHHTSQELSHTIIKLQGLKFVKEKDLKSTMLDYSNNNENLRDQVIVETEKKNIHDESYCSLNCSQFIAWEHELNKRTEICDNDFYNIVEELCTDLINKKERGRKRKNETITSEIKTKSIIQHIKGENIEAQSETSGTLNHLDLHNSTPNISFLKIENSYADTAANDEICKTKETTTIDDTLTTIAVDLNTNILLYNPLNGLFYWTRVTDMYSGEKEVSTKEIM